MLHVEQWTLRSRMEITAAPPVVREGSGEGWGSAGAKDFRGSVMLDRGLAAVRQMRAV
jgi:hypothetical protein